MMQQSNSDLILAEKRKIRKYFAWRFSIAVFFAFLYSLFAYLYVFVSEDPPGYEKLQGILLFLLPTILILITIRIFAIPETTSVKEYPEFKRAMMTIYLCWLVPNIIFPLLPLQGIIPLAAKVKLCIVLFIFSLNMLILYVLIIYSSIYDTLIRLFNLSAIPFLRGSRINDIKIYEKTNQKIFSMGRLIIHALHEYDGNTFSIGLGKIDTLGKILMASSKLDPELVNRLFNNIVINYRHAAAESLEAKSENYLKDTLAKIDSLGKVILESSTFNLKLLNDSFKNIITCYQYIALECLKSGSANDLMLTFSNITNLIKYGMGCPNELTSKINYPIAVTEVGKVGVMTIKNNIHPVGNEIIDHLAQIGEKSLNHQLDHPPDLEVLTALQDIGTECANKKLENLCFETLIRTEFLGIQALNSVESAAEPGRKKEKEKVYKSALTSHWIVSAFLFKNIPESEEWLKDSRTRMEEVFGSTYKEAYNQALKKMNMTSYVGKRLLIDYYEAIREYS
jgi:uncharacterized protein YihD (DUF1040 family)